MQGAHVAHGGHGGHGHYATEDHTNRTKVINFFLKKFFNSYCDLSYNQVQIWYHRCKIAALVVVWIFFTYLLMSFDEKEIVHRQIAILSGETKSK